MHQVFLGAGLDNGSPTKTSSISVTFLSMWSSYVPMEFVSFNRLLAHKMNTLGKKPIFCLHFNHKNRFIVMKRGIKSQG